MNLITIREPELKDEAVFLAMTERSHDFHAAWIKAPLTASEYQAYVVKHQCDPHRAYLTFDVNNHLIGVFNISGIIRGAFESAYLGFYANALYAGKGLMSASLKLVLQKIFEELKLHRIEANVQPDNLPSLRLIEKNGFRKEGFSPRYLKINEIWRDHERWALTVEDWASSQSIK